MAGKNPDIVELLRDPDRVDWNFTTFEQRRDLVEEAADEIERLRRLLAVDRIEDILVSGIHGEKDYGQLAREIAAVQLDKS